MNTVGTGKYTYEVVENWRKLPQGQAFKDVSAVAVDSQDKVYVFQRTDPPVLVFDTEGNFLSSWGNGALNFSHGIDIDTNDVVYLTDRDDHVAMTYTLDGRPLMILGTRGQHSDTGCTEDAGTVLRAAGPFNKPAGMVRAPSGDLYVADGYRNSRIHRFSADGSLKASWGNPGKTAPNEFHVPHCLWVDKEGIVYVCDRENSRVQVFTADGKFMAQWTDMHRPTAIYMDADETVYVTELAPCVSIWDKSGELIERLEAPQAHWLYGDSRGNLYLTGAGVPDVAKYVKQS